MKAKKQGGKRSKAGRKPIADKMVPVTIYLRKSYVDKVGSQVMRELLTSYATNAIA